MKAKSSLIECLAVIGICVILVYLEHQFGALSLMSSALSRTMPGIDGTLGAVGAGSWIGMTVYSLRRRHGLRQQVEAHRILQSTLELAVITDEVTGLPNRQGLEAYFNMMADRPTDRQDLMLVGLSVSNLKLVGDVQGFRAAGAIAQSVTDRLVQHVALPDFLACVNGQQFYLLLADPVDGLRGRATALIDTLIESLRSIVLSNGTSLPLSVHVGTATLSHCPRAAGLPVAAEMMRRCDLAVHEATLRSAGSVVVFDAAMEQAIDQRALIEASLDQAIRQGEIEPYFQPLINLADQSITAFEVLARWTHPTMGPIPPATFIPIATEAGRLEALTIMMLDRACRAAAGWAGEFKLAFNISPRSLNDERFMTDFLSTLTDTTFDRHRIEVEITEDAFVKDASILSTAIRRLKQEGISLAIDDFGTGYSSLRHLQIMPFDKIKIDQSFVKDMASNPESRKIVEAIVGLGRSMGLLTVAEGIEGETERSMLARLGCETGQGYLFARPMPASEVMAFVGRQRRPVSKTSVMRKIA